jgi:hypothetical protein
MAVIQAPNWRIRRIEWELDRPAQMNVSAYTGRSKVVANPWHGKWRAKVEMAPIVREENIRPWRAFFAKLRGQVNTFRLPATEGKQNSNNGVEVASTAAANATSITITGAGSPLFAGQRVTVNGQLLQLTDVSGNTLTFEPPLRAEAEAGTTVVTSEPYALVRLSASAWGEAVDVGQVYGFAFDAEEAIGETDPSPPEGSPYAGYAIALDFDSQKYWAGGTRYNPLSAFPGYTFTRSGEQGAVDASGAVQWFAANVPAINSAGYHAYGALTNLLIYSQQIDQWSFQSGATITPNNITAPDGTSTADTMTGSGSGTPIVFVSPAPPVSGGQTYTWSFFAKPGTCTWLALGTFDGTNDVRQYYDLANGVLGSAENGSFIDAGIEAMDDGWYRCWAIRAVAGGATDARVQINQATADLTLASNTTTTTHLWQAQLLPGNFPDGGPLIRTTSAAASIGASSLSVGDAPSDGDQIFSVTVDYQNLDPTTSDFFASWSDGVGGNNAVHLFGQIGYPTFQIYSGGSLVYSAQSAASQGTGIITFVARRSGGNWRGGWVKNGVLTWVGAETAGAFPAAAMNKIYAGARADPAHPAKNPVRGIFRKLGTFDTDAKVLAAIAESS